MHRVLIIDNDTDFAELLHKHIRHGYLVEVCKDSNVLLEIIRSFEPDIVVMDAFLHNVDIWFVLQVLADTGRMPGLIVMSRKTDTYFLKMLATYGVTNVFSKPCKISAVAARIHEISVLLHSDWKGLWCVENELDNMLLRLMFQIGTKGYNHVYCAVMERYREPDATVTKHIYPKIAKQNGSNIKSVEKLIRNTIEAAFNRGDALVWKCYFQPGEDDELKCPSNDVFIGRLSGCLRQRERIKPPYISLKQKKA